MRIIKVAAIAAFAFSSIAVHAAPLYGSTVNYTWYFPDLSTPVFDHPNGNYVVGAGVEVHKAIGIFQDVTLDVTENQIIFQSNERADNTYFIGGASFNGWELSDVFGDIDAFTLVTIDASSTWTAFDTSRLQYSENAIRIDVDGLILRAGERLVLDIGAAAAHSVPEPRSLALSSLALALAGLARRRVTKGRRRAEPTIHLKAQTMAQA